MKNTLVSIAAYLIANGVGLLLAILLIDGFSVAFTAFVFAVVLFCVIQAIASPIANKLSQNYAPQLVGGIALIPSSAGGSALRSAPRPAARRTARSG